MGGDPVCRVGIDVAGDGVDCCHVTGKPANLRLLVKIRVDEGFLVGGAVTDTTDELHVSFEIGSATARGAVSYTHLTLPTTPYG